MLIGVMLCFLGKVKGVSWGIAVRLIESTGTYFREACSKKQKETDTQTEKSIYYYFKRFCDSSKEPDSK